MRTRTACALLLFALATIAVRADESKPKLAITRASGPITIDGNLSDPAWTTATHFETWYETNPGDNIAPKVKQVGYVTYDDHFFYVGIDMWDPTPQHIGGNFGDHDQINGNSDDFAGVILDTRNDGKTGYEFFVSARGVQYDAVQDEAVGNEDSSPDFYWDAEARINEHGWSMEMRIPFSSLRYTNANPEQWGLILYRNWPRDRRYQIFTQAMPRGANCFLCNAQKIVGLKNLPSGGHIVAAPYVTAREIGETENGFGSPIVTRPAKGDGGLDVKWTPNADTAVDGTLNPDFSQVESDVAAISTNERFAIFFPEKRPFFLEGSELFNTPIQAVYTRTITSPRWGLRSTGKIGKDAYTLLVADDRGGGSVIIPSTFGSNFANQEFSSTAAIGRVRRDFFTSSFVSFLGTARMVRGGGHNLVFGPDFQLKNEHHSLTGQFLMSDTRTPDHPELADEWNGQRLRSTAAWLYYTFSSRKWDLLVDGRHFGKDFRADNGFIPQVGYRVNYAEGGRTFYPEKSFFSRVRVFSISEYDSTYEGKMLYRQLSLGAGADGKFRSFSRWRFSYENIRNGNDVFQRHQLLYTEQFSLNHLVPQVSVDGWVGQDIDFANDRLGRGAKITVGGTVQPTSHLDIRLTNSVRWLDVAPNGISNRLFTAQVERIRATYTFNNRMFVRAIVQNQRTNSDQLLYQVIINPDGSRQYAVPQHSGTLASQLLVAYKLNWQTLMYVGAGDLRDVGAIDGDLQPSNRQIFMKVSYAFQK